MKQLKIAMMAPPWLTVPAHHYGGTESVIDNLCRGLAEAGVHVEFFGVEGSRTPAARHHWTYHEEHYNQVGGAMFDSAAIPATHVLAALDRIRRQGDFDLIHDHNSLFGPMILAGRTDLPPVLHTLHGPFATPDRLSQGQIDTDAFYGIVAKADNVYFNAISHAQAAQAPGPMQRKIVAAIHHGINPASHPVYPHKQDYVVNVGRISAEKGIHVAAEVSEAVGLSLKLGGVVAGVGNPAELTRALAEPTPRLDHDPDFQYFRDKVEPWVQRGVVEYVGSVGGAIKDDLLGRARAFVMAIQWDEPFGVAVIDALVCGTPVVALRRGSMPEIIQHGVNGFLADTPEELAMYLRRVDEIDPLVCRRTIEERFTYRTMSDQYLAVYHKLAGRTQALPTARSFRIVSQLLPAAPGTGFYEQVRPATKTKPRRPALGS